MSGHEEFRWKHVTLQICGSAHRPPAGPDLQGQHWIELCNFGWDHSFVNYDFKNKNKLNRHEYQNRTGVWQCPIEFWSVGNFSAQWIVLEKQ